MKSFIFLFLFSLIANADIDRFSLVKTDSLTIHSPDGSVSLTVEIERFDRKKITMTETDEEFKVWFGKRELPVDVLVTPTMIKKFELTIDDKKVTIPKNFWNDIGGFRLRKLVIDPKRPIQGAEDGFKLEEFLAQNSRSFPTVSRTPGGSTVLITWVRPEE